MEHEVLEQQRTAQRAAAPRRAAVGTREAGMLALQRSAGNQAVASLVQRDTGDWWSTDTPFSSTPSAGASSTATPTGVAPSTTPAETPEAGAAGGINELGPVARVGTLIADSIVATSYTPGAGNIW
jgi:hypothetical protein